MLVFEKYSDNSESRIYVYWYNLNKSHKCFINIKSRIWNAAMQRERKE